jgi:hypothetical protein
MYQKQLVTVAAGGLLQPLDVTSDFRLAVGATTSLHYAPYEGFAMGQLSDR